MAIAVFVREEDEWVGGKLREVDELAERFHAAEVLVTAGVRICRVGRRRIVSVHPSWDTPELRKALHIQGLSGLDIQYTFLLPSMPATEHEQKRVSGKG